MWLLSCQARHGWAEPRSPSLAEDSAANAAITRTSCFTPNEPINMKTSPTMKKTLVLIAAGALFATAVYGFPDYEAFNYTVGNNLTNCGHWYVAGTSSAAQLTIASGNLIYNGLAPSQGNKVSFGGTGEGARVALSSLVTAGTVYWSALVNFTNLSSIGTASALWAGFNNTTGGQAGLPGVLAARFYTKTNSVLGGFIIGVDNNSGQGSDLVYEDTNTVHHLVNETNFIVAAYVMGAAFGGGDDYSQMWINPDPSTFGSNAPPAATLTTTTGPNMSGSGVASFALSNRLPSGGTSMYGYFDELRISTNWADVTPTPSIIGFISQPSNQRVMVGNTATFSVSAFGATTYRWQKNLGDIPGATNTSLSISNAQATDAGTYDVVVGNGVISTNSSNAILTVVPDIYPRLAPLWKVAPFSRPYLTIDTGTALEHCIAYNALSNQVLVVSVTNTVTGSTNPAIYVLDADTGADLYQMFVDPTVVQGGLNNLYTLSSIDVADDGAVYAANLIGGGQNGLRIYRWDNSGPDAGPVVIYNAFPANVRLRWGDALAVRGAGTNTQILVDDAQGVDGAILVPSDPTLTAIWTENDFTNVAGGLTWGRTLLFYGTNNTFWEKHFYAGLNLVSYDTSADTSLIVTNFPDLPGSPNLLAFNSATNVLCAINYVSSTNTPDTLDLYDISDPAQAIYVASYNFPANHQPNQNGCGRVIFAGDRVFALDSDNGMAAYTLVPVLHITLSAPNVVLSWSADVTGYTLKATPSLASPITWTNVGTGTLVGNQYFVTNSPSAASLFYRLQK